VHLLVKIIVIQKLNESLDILVLHVPILRLEGITPMCWW